MGVAESEVQGGLWDPCALSLLRTTDRSACPVPRSRKEGKHSIHRHLLNCANLPAFCWIRHCGCRWGDSHFQRLLRPSSAPALRVPCVFLSPQHLFLAQRMLQVLDLEFCTSLTPDLSLPQLCFCEMLIKLGKSQLFQYLGDIT